jgi:hypothetical protein
VQRQHELHLGVVAQGVHEPLLGGARVAEDATHPVGQELLDHGALPGHPRHVDLPRSVLGILSLIRRGDDALQDGEVGTGLGNQRASYCRAHCVAFSSRGI